MTKHKVIFRKDYKPSNYLIKSTDLVFEIEENQTYVSSTIQFYKNNALKNTSNELFLNGKDLELLSILKNGESINYILKENGILITNLEDEFILEIKTKIHPEKNTTLSGFYKSSSIYCTQCEAHGFSQIMYYLDRPDVLSIFSTTIIADKTKHPILLSNGNLKAKKDLKDGKHLATWVDPQPKPCYLFALVAGDLALIEDKFITKSKKEVKLQIFVEKHNINKTKFAIEALKSAFLWEEQRFNLEYDLDIYMIVAVDDFNMGAMENKGLNIFNSHYVLANSNTATDKDFVDIEAVIGHEYFHNWTGNRVTCQDWFQLSLKEGLTVFRDQEFISDLYSRGIKRIEDVRDLRSYQFYEDSGPMAHPVRPESYIEVNNFYTATVYEKGAELIRMLHTLLTEDGFQKGIDLYLKTFDGKAATIDNFVWAMSVANNYDLEHFKLWYSQKGTPKIIINTDFDKDNDKYIVKIKQITNDNKPLFIPLVYGLLDSNSNNKEIKKGLLIINRNQQTIEFNNINKKPIASWFRGFSAPIILEDDLSFDDRLFIIKNDTDNFNIWDNSQKIWLNYLLNRTNNKEKIFTAFKDILAKNTNTALTAEMFLLPSERFLQQQLDEIDVFAINNKREKLIYDLALELKNEFYKTYNKLNVNKEYKLSPKDIADRSLKNLSLYYLSHLKEYDLAYEQYKNANCMTDKIQAFQCLLKFDNKYRADVINDFYNIYQDDTEVIDKWFTIQASSTLTNVNTIHKLMSHPKFCFNTPNRLRSVIGSFSQNYPNFHTNEGYELLTDIILRLNKSNPQIGARMVSIYNHWHKFRDNERKLQKQQLEKIYKISDLSDDIFEIVSKALN